MNRRWLDELGCGKSRVPETFLHSYNAKLPYNRRRFGRSRLNEGENQLSVGPILELCSVAYVVAIIIEFCIRKQLSRFLMEAAAIVVVIAIALLVNNAATGRVAFGQAASPIGTVGIMLAVTACGIAARYIFYLQKGRFSWLDFCKPITISPIVLLPLIGSVQTTGELSPMQVVSFAVLAFQNGFFWQAVLEGAKPAVQAPVKE